MPKYPTSTLELGFFNKCYVNLYTVLSVASSLVMTLGSDPNEQAKTLFVFIYTSTCL